MFTRIVLGLALTATAAGQKLKTVNISVQPAYHGIPMYIAQKKGWFKQLGLEVKFTVFASGAPQVRAAVENKAWDIGIAGSVPNVLAGQQGIQSIAINNDESKTTEVIAGKGVTEWPPTTLSKHVFGATPKSTGELLLRKCLAASGLSFNDNHILMDTQKSLMDRLESDEDPQYACLWAPNTYTYRERDARAKVVCSGRDINFPIYGGVMVREEWGLSNEDTVKKVMAAYLRGVNFMQNTALRDEVIDLSDKYHIFTGNTLSETALKEDLILRPLYNLDEQLVHMNRNFANNYTSDADRHYIALEDFLFDQGVIEKKHLPKEYVTDAYLLAISNDPELRAFSYYSSADFSTASIGTSSAELKYLSTGLGFALGVFYIFGELF